MPMLKAVHLKDFKNHISTDIELGRLTCLVGPNGSGKTSVMEGIHFVGTSLEQGAVAFFKAPYRFEDFVRKGREEFFVGIEVIGGESGGHWINIELRGKDEAHSLDTSAQAENIQKISVTGEWKTNWDREAALDKIINGSMKSSLIAADSRPMKDIMKHGWNQSYIPPGYELLKPSSFLFSPNIKALRSPSYSPDEIPIMSADGATLASVIAYLITTEPERFGELMKSICAVLPSVERLRIRPAKVELHESATVTTKGKVIPYIESRDVIGHELLFDLKEGKGIPARAVSEGTLLVTALLTATVWNQGADILMIDDVEKGLHPKAQRELVSALKTLIELESDLQIVFSTHSPYIVDELEADQIWILVPDADLGVIAKRLSDHPRASDALEVLTTGEFLSAEGEDWVRNVAGEN